MTTTFAATIDAAALTFAVNCNEISMTPNYSKELELMQPCCV
jgi:hypothetical protein